MGESSVMEALAENKEVRHGGQGLQSQTSLGWGCNLFWVLVLKGLVGLRITVQLQLLQHYWSGHRLGLLWY